MKLQGKLWQENLIELFYHYDIMLSLMLDPQFKSLYLVSSFVGHQQGIFII
jgi:hypothetical protein